MSAYIGRKKCGCVVAVCADIPGFKREAKAFIVELLNDGYGVERVSDEYAREHLKVCKCGPPVAQATATAQQNTDATTSPTPQDTGALAPSTGSTGQV